MADSSGLILASASPRRLDLLKQIHITPDAVCPADINEDDLPRELPKAYVKRITIAKATKIAETYSDHYILSADTTVASGRRILPKAEDEQTARDCLKMLSGRRHRVLGGIALITPCGKALYRLSETVVKFKRLSQQDIEDYIDSKEWHGKAGGYAIQGLAASYVQSISGSYSNVVGLSLFETTNMLKGAGYVGN